MALTQEQIENIQIDYGIVYINYGETDHQKMLGPTRGGGEFVATATIRDIEYDGSKGKTKGMQVVDDITAQLNVTQLNTSMDTLKMALPFAKYDVTGKLSVGSNSVGVIPDEAYLKNITMFAKVIGGGYKKITLYNALSENGLTLAAAPKAEGTIALNVFAHWDATDDTKNLFEIEDVESIKQGGETCP